MARLDVSDIKLTPEGDFVMDGAGLEAVQKQEYIAQSARIRVKVSDPEWFDLRTKDIGANLEDLIGMPNSPETAELGVEKIGEALTRDGLVESDDIYIRPVPVGRYYIAFYLFISTTEDAEPQGFEILFNLETGLEIGSV